MTTKFQIIAIIATFTVFIVGTLYIRALQAEIKLVTSQRDYNRAVYTQCVTDSQTAYEVSHGYQTKLRALDRQHADLKRVLDNAVCVPIGDTAGGHHATAAGGELSRPHGLLAEPLLAYARDAEQVRLQLIACQDWITRTRKEE